MDEPLLTRDEVTQALLARFDLNHNVYRIRVAVEDEDGQDPGEAS